MRFRTLGCYPLTGAVESEAATLPEIIQEMLLTKTSERQGRVIDHDLQVQWRKRKWKVIFNRRLKVPSYKKQETRRFASSY